jgi:hypothetical protein
MKKYSSGYFSLIYSDKTILMACLIGFAVAFSCTSALYIPASNHETTTASLSDLQAGRKLYIQKCAGCHTLYLPEKYTTAEWHHWVDEMTKKVSLDTLEKQHILQYLSRGNQNTRDTILNKGVR